MRTPRPSEGKHASRASPSPSTRRDSRPSSPVGRKTRAAHETETEMQQSLVTEEEAAAQVEAQLASARAAWENEQHQREVERQHAEQVEQLTSQLAIAEAEATHTREEKAALQLEVAVQKKIIAAAEDVRRSDLEAAAAVREERSIAVADVASWQAEARVRAEALERMEARVTALDAALDAGRGAVGQERQWGEERLAETRAKAHAELTRQMREGVAASAQERAAAEARLAEVIMREQRANEEREVAVAEARAMQPPLASARLEAKLALQAKELALAERAEEAVRAAAAAARAEAAAAELVEVDEHDYP